MKKFFLLFMIASTLLFADSDIQKILQHAKEAFSVQKAVNVKREAIFLEKLSAQKMLLQQAKEEVALLKKESLRLNAIIDTNEKSLSILEEKLHQRSGNLGELYGVVRQSAGDFFALAEQSPTTVLEPKRLEFLKQLSKTKKLPDTKQLTHFWYLMLQELSLHGKVWHLKVPLIQTNGSVLENDIMLNGPFASIYEEGFVQYLPDTKSFAVLSKQPDSHFTSIAEDAYSTDASMTTTVIDPTRGQLLAIATEAPSFFERIEQGSTVGYLIILLGFIGLSYAAWRAFELFQMDLAISRKDAKSPLIQLHSHYNSHKQLSLEQLELTMEERMSKAKTGIEKGLAMIKLLAAVSPLMGLLGTVTGMIATFSAITLFGTGDPKLMAGGISQALITTVEGLIVAIPLLFAYTMLNSRAKVILAKLDEEALQLLSQHK